MKRQPNGKMNYLYGRLSNEDERYGESMSIENQRKILTKYAEENGFYPYKFVCDDGYSGADWDRPVFNEILEDVEAGLVRTLITKDRSRLGRDRLKIGFITEILFPKHDVRYIAIHDNTDSERDDEIAPIIDLFNEWFLKSTSKKIRAVIQAKGKAGERLAVIPPYGYRKSEDKDKKTLVIDEESAAVVRRIFRLSVEGNGPARIARLLNGEHLLNPSAYKHERGILKKPRPMKDPYRWNTTTVHRILDAPEYLGITINFKTYSKSYKDNRPRLNPKEKQLMFEGTHEPIIDLDTWEIVRRMREHKRRSSRYGNPGLFSGTAYCSDCGGKLYFSTREIWNKAHTQARYEGAYSCAAYRKDVQFQRERLCTCHYIRECQLETLVFGELRELLAYAARDEKTFVRRVIERSRAAQTNEVAAKRKAVKDRRRRANELDILFERLYEDRAAGKITEERFEKLSAKYEDEQAALSEALAATERQIAEIEQKTANADRFIALVRRYTAGIEELTPAIVHEFIDKIIVHEAESKRKNRTQKIEIFYNNIGAFCISGAPSESAETLAATPPADLPLVASF